MDLIANTRRMFMKVVPVLMLVTVLVINFKMSVQMKMLFTK